MNEELIFINYRRRDSGTFSNLLAESLKMSFGKESVFIDTKSIRTGDNWSEKIETALEKASIILVVIGSEWLTLQDKFGRRRLDNKNDWVKNEIAHGLSKKNVKVIPVLLQGVDQLNKDALPKEIKGLTDFQSTRLSLDSWEQDRDNLIAAISKSGIKLKKEQIEYPIPQKFANELTNEEINDVLSRFSNWDTYRQPNTKAKNGESLELKRDFKFHSFEDAMHFMMVATRHISQVNHHPNWRNVWRTVSVSLSTWDIGHQVSSYDCRLVEVLEDLYQQYEPKI